MEWGVFVGAGGALAAIITSIIAFRKAGSETTSILVDAAKDVVVIQKGELDRLNAQLSLIRNQLAEAEARAWKAEASASELSNRLRALEKRMTHEEARNTEIELQADQDREDAR